MLGGGLPVEKGVYLAGPCAVLTAAYPGPLATDPASLTANPGGQPAPDPGALTTAPPQTSRPGPRLPARAAVVPARPCDQVLFGRALLCAVQAARRLADAGGFWRGARGAAPAVPLGPLLQDPFRQQPGRAVRAAQLPPIHGGRAAATGHLLSPPPGQGGPPRARRRAPPLARPEPGDVGLGGAFARLVGLYCQNHDPRKCTVKACAHAPNVVTAPV